MWEPRLLTTIWASTACYRDNFTFTIRFLNCTTIDFINDHTHRHGTEFLERIEFVSNLSCVIGLWISLYCVFTVIFIEHVFLEHGPRLPFHAFFHSFVSLYPFQVHENYIWDSQHNKLLKQRRTRYTVSTFVYWRRC
jgi:hypothetical protein